MIVLHSMRVVPGSLARALLPAALAMLPAFAGAAVVDDNLGFKWKFEPPAGFTATLDRPKNTTSTRAGGATGVPFTVSGALKNLDKVVFNFEPAANPDPKSINSIGRFFMSLNLVNQSGVDWRGFNLAIIDGNDTPYAKPSNRTNGSLLHPTRAHFHVDLMKQADLVFRQAEVDLITLNAQDKVVVDTVRTDATKEDNSGNKQDISDETRGVYAIRLSDAELRVKDKATWKPLYFDPDLSKGSLLDIHLMRPNDEWGNARFSIELTPIAAVVPLPAAPLLLASGLLALGICARRPHLGSCGR